MHILIMPRQGNTVESCIIVDWKVKEGDEVTAVTTVCEVETDKATFEIPSGEAGTVLKILQNAGDDVPILKPIAIIGADGEDWQAALAPTALSAQPDPQPHAPHISISPRARILAEKESLPLPVPGTGPGGRIIERDVLAALENRPPLTAAAKAEAIGTIPAEGTGIGGRVTTADLISPHPPAYTETPIKGIRKIISDRMRKSLEETAQFTLNASAPVSRLQEIRSRMKASEGFGVGLSKITVNDLILFAVSRVLMRYPFMNAHKTDDTIRIFNHVNLGFAADTPKGLMVPVIRNANLLSLARISSESKRLSAACQNGSARPDELSGSTFTVSNLGSLGITGFTPILNMPEAAILGVCGIELKPVALSGDEAECNCDCDCGCGGVRFEPHIGFSLTINHQIVDGAPAARFLKALCEAVADIDLLLAAG